MTWKRSVVSTDGTHHVVDGQPLYRERFHRVQKFHDPGLAPAVDGSGAFHITPSGASAYGARFRTTWGFYEERAAVADESGWFHITRDGTAVSKRRDAWCGNFQEGRCAVREPDGRYMHISLDGAAAYSGRYLYAGDFRDGAAVVRCSTRNLCTHIDAAGRIIHGRWFIDLDVFHKGHARARDAKGWFHVGIDGEALYAERFVTLEPYYNGTALAENRTGDRVLVDYVGKVILVVAHAAPEPRARLPNVKIVVVGNIAAGKSELGSRVAAAFGWPHLAIDDCRRAHSDGSPAGELNAWAEFARATQSSGPQVLEFSGSGPMLQLVKRALSESGASVVAVWVDTPADVCLQRLSNRRWNVPYPEFGVPIESVVRELETRLAEEIGVSSSWSHYMTATIDGLDSAEVASAKAVTFLTGWLRGQTQ